MVDFPGLKFSEVDGKLIAHNQAVADRPSLDASLLHALLKQAGYDNWFFPEEALATLVTRCNATPAEFEMPLGERRDGSFSLDIASDALTATLNLTPACGGKAVATDEVMQALTDAGVVFGIAGAAIKQACEANVAANLAAAVGIPAQHGEDTRFEPLIDLVRDRAPKVNAQGLIDFRELGDIPMVEAGVDLMRRTPATAGVDGRDVRGLALPANPGRDKPFSDKLLGTAPANEDPNLLRSLIKGQPVSVGNGICVEEILSVKDVDLGSGNITFDGSIRINGDVMSGMKVHATGDIVVTGIVEGGELEAGGNIQVSGGIIAHSKAQAGGSVTARFVEGSSIRAGTVIAIDDMVLQSELHALNQIDIGVKSPQRGKLVGGTTQTMLLLRVPLLGDEHSGVTNVQVGVNSELEAKYQELLHQVEKQDVLQDKFKHLIDHHQKHGDPHHMIGHAKTAWKQSVQKMAEFLKEKVELEKERVLLKKARLEIGVGVAGSVDVSFGKQTRTLRRSFEGGSFFLDEDGRIVFSDRKNPTGATT